jgi:hypothetical protein
MCSPSAPDGALEAPCYTRVVRILARRLALAVIVGLLMFGASGASALVRAEPCTTYEPPGSEDGSCPPTCVTCGCCAQAAEPVTLAATSSPDVPTAEIASVVPLLPETRPRAIWHVPKPRLS